MSIFAEMCMVDVIDLNATIGIVVEKRGSQFCKNLKSIKGLAECRGSCSSSTRFDQGKRIFFLNLKLI